MPGHLHAANSPAEPQKDGWPLSVVDGYEQAEDPHRDHPVGQGRLTAGDHCLARRPRLAVQKYFVGQQPTVSVGDEHAQTVHLSGQVLRAQCLEQLVQQRRGGRHRSVGEVIELGSRPTSSPAPPLVHHRRRPVCHTRRESICQDCA